MWLSKVLTNLISVLAPLFIKGEEMHPQNCRALLQIMPSFLASQFVV